MPSIVGSVRFEFDFGMITVTGYSGSCFILGEWVGEASRGSTGESSGCGSVSGSSSISG